MMQQQPQPHQPDQNFTFQYSQNNPDSLTMTRQTSYLYSLLFCPPTYIWISAQNGVELLIEQLRKDTGVLVDWCPTVEEARDRIVGMENVIVVCGLGELGVVGDRIGKLNAVKSILCFGQDTDTNSLQPVPNPPPHFLRHTKTLPQLSQFIIQRSPETNTQRQQLTNFILMSQHIYQSNLLIKTLSAMINQETDKEGLCGEMEKLATMVGMVGVEREKDGVDREDGEDEEDGVEDGEGQEGSRGIFGEFREYVLGDVAEKGDLDWWRVTVWWYVRECFLYKLVNKLLRVGRHPADVYCIQPYFKNLFKTILACYRPNQRRIICYRGGAMSQKQLDYFVQGAQMGAIFQNLGFLSASKNLQTAQNFSRNVILQIQVPHEERDKNSDFGFVDVEQLIKQMTGEEQIIFNALNHFKILSLDLESFPHVIKLRYGEVAAILKRKQQDLNAYEKKIKDLAQYQMKSFNQISSMGDIIVGSDQSLKGGLSYWETYLKLAVDRSQVLKALFKISQAYTNMGLFDKALQHLEESMCILNESSDSSNSYHKQTMLVYTLVAQIYSNRNQPQTSLPYLQKALSLSSPTSTPTLTPQHQITLYGLLGTVYSRLSEHDKALQYFTKCQQLIKTHLPQNHPAYGLLLRDVGLEHLRVGKYGDALGCFLGSRGILGGMLGWNSGVIGQVCGNIGVVYDQMGQYNKALEYFQTSSQILHNLPTHCQPPQIPLSTLYSQFGSIYSSLHQYTLSLQYSKKCLQIQQKVYHAQHPQLMTTLGNIGSACINLGKLGEAEEYLGRAWGILGGVRGKGRGREGWYQEEVYLGNHFGNLEFQRGRYQLALDYFQRSKQILLTKLSTTHLLFHIITQNINLTQTQLSQSQSQSQPQPQSQLQPQPKPQPQPQSKSKSQSKCSNAHTKTTPQKQSASQ